MRINGRYNMILSTLNVLQLISGSIYSTSPFRFPAKVCKELLLLNLSGNLLSTFYGFDGDSTMYLFSIESNIYSDSFNSSYAVAFTKQDFLNNYSVTLQEKVEKKSKEEIHNIIMKLNELKHPHIQECYKVFESENFYFLLYENDSKFSRNKITEDCVLCIFQYKKILFTAFSGLSFLYEHEIFNSDNSDSFLVGLDRYYNIKLSGFIGILSYLSDPVTKRYIVKNNDLYKILNDDFNNSETYLKLKNSVFIKFIENFMNMLLVYTDKNLPEANFDDLLTQETEKLTINFKNILECDYFEEVTFKFMNFINLQDFDRETYSGIWNKRGNIVKFQDNNKQVYKIIQAENTKTSMANETELFSANFQFFIDDDEINPNNLFEDEFKLLKEKIVIISNELQIFKDATFKYVIYTELFLFYETFDGKNFLVYKKDLLDEINIFMVEKDGDSLFLVDEKYLKIIYSSEHPYYDNIVDFINFLIFCYYETENDKSYEVVGSECNSRENINACDSFKVEINDRSIGSEFYIHQLARVFIPGIGFMKELHSSKSGDGFLVYEISNYNVKVIFDELELSLYEEGDRSQCDRTILYEHNEAIKKLVTFLFEASISCRIRKF